MREIKFRALMQNDNKEYFVSDGYGIDNKLSYLFDFENERWDYFLDMITTSLKFTNIFDNEDEYMNGWCHLDNLQYTGLKDKNGVEIYEGDIIRHDGSIEEVIWENGNLYVNGTSGKWIFNNSMTIMADAVEVIGNIYENSELLK